VAASPDGKSVYVTSPVPGGISIFDRNATSGALTQKAGSAGCIRNEPTAGCADGAGGLDGAEPLVVSPDGLTVYVAGRGDDAVAILDRSTTTGALTQSAGADGCVDDAGEPPCTDALALREPKGIAISPDGENVYAAADADAAIAAFARGASGGPGPKPPPGPTPSEPPVIGKIKRSVDKGTVTVTITVSGPGEISLTATANRITLGRDALERAKKTKVATAQKTAAEAGDVKLKLKPKGKAKKALKKEGKLKAKLKAVFTPADGGDPTVSSERLVFKRK
jgi:DNA-binding beta-propeller fold protein YncE